MRQPHSSIRRIVSRGQVDALSLLVLLRSVLLFARTRHLSEARRAGQEHANPAGQRGLGLSSLSEAPSIDWDRRSRLAFRAEA